MIRSGRFRTLRGRMPQSAPSKAASEERRSIGGLKPNLGLAHLIQLWRTRGLRCPFEGPCLLEYLPRAVEQFGSAGRVGKVLVRIGD